MIRLVALPEVGVVVSVQASTPPTDHAFDAYNNELVRLTEILRDAARG